MATCGKQLDTVRHVLMHTVCGLTQDGTEDAEEARMRRVVQQLLAAGELSLRRLNRTVSPETALVGSHPLSGW